MKDLTETQEQLRNSAKRLAFLIDNGPPNVVMQECGLLVRFMARVAGPDTIRTWLDEWVDIQLADLEVGDPGVECTHCRGLGRACTADGRNPVCRHCRGLGRV